MYRPGTIARGETTHAWTFDERAHAGGEHLDPAEVARFDEKLPFDPTPEAEVLHDAGLTTADTVVDFGTGTNGFPLAVDVSDAMLDVVRERVANAGVENVEVVHEGFLDCDHEGSPAPYAFSKNALHHLPDFWKVEALKTVGEALEPGGTFRLCDFVFSFEPSENVETIDEWIAAQASTLSTGEEVYTHLRDEFSTYGFLRESMLDRAGFEILDATYPNDVDRAVALLRISSLYP